MYILYDDYYEYFYTALDTNNATKLIVKLKVLSPVQNSFELKWLLPFNYFVLHIIEDRFDQGFSISDQNVLKPMIAKICKTYSIPISWTIPICMYKNVLEGMSRFPRLIQYAELYEDNITYNELHLDEMNYILSGQQIKYRNEMSIGFEKLYDKYKKWI